jgi:8-oxo-dGTP diphosphatase
VNAVRDRVHRLLLEIYRHLPRRLRRVLVRAGTPKYTVGAICIVVADDGRILLVRHSYGDRWGTPGGLAKRNEQPAVAAVRETREEVHLDIELDGEPVVVVEPRPHRVDVVFVAHPRPGVDLEQIRPTSAEIVAVDWFRPGDLPDLQSETANALAALVRAGRLPAPS